MPKYNNFDEWMDENEGYSVRRERFTSDVYSSDPKLMEKWLHQAWDLGAALDTDFPIHQKKTDYEKVARYLFDLLDDIDTASDIAKSNDAAYRKYVEQVQKRRFMVAETDGYMVTFK